MPKLKRYVSDNGIGDSYIIYAERVKWVKAKNTVGRWSFYIGNVKVATIDGYFEPPYCTTTKEYALD